MTKISHFTITFFLNAKSEQAIKKTIKLIMPELVEIYAKILDNTKACSISKGAKNDALDNTENLRTDIQAITQASSSNSVSSDISTPQNTSRTASRCQNLIASHAHDARTNSISFSLQARFVSWSDAVLAHIKAAQNFAYSYTITGDIGHEIDLFSDKTRLSEIKAVSLQARMGE